MNIVFTAHLAPTLSESKVLATALETEPGVKQQPFLASKPRTPTEIIVPYVVNISSKPRTQMQVILFSSYVEDFFPPVIMDAHDFTKIYTS